MSLRVVSSVQATEEGSKLLASFLRTHKNVPVLLLCSGGSALTLLDDATVEGYNLTFGLIDERFAVEEREQNLPRVAQSLMVKRALSQGASLIALSGVSGAECATHYEDQLRKWCATHPAGVIGCILGMGADGHTAGIFPFPESRDDFEALFEAEAWVVSYDASGKNQFAHRVTVTNTFLRKAQWVLLFATGEAKREKLRAALAGAPAHEVPASVVRSCTDVVVVTDLSL